MKSGAISVQAVRKRHGRAEVFKHLGSAHTNTELALLVDQARRFLGLNLQLSFELEGIESADRYPSMADFAKWIPTDGLAASRAKA